MAAARAKCSPKAKEAKALCRDHILLDSAMTRQNGQFGWPVVECV